MRHYPRFLMRCEAAWRHHSFGQSKPPEIKKFRAHLADRRRILLGGSAQCPGLLSAKTMNQAGRYSAARAKQSLRVAGRIPWASLAAKIHLCADEGGPFSVVEKPTECTHPPLNGDPFLSHLCKLVSLIPPALLLLGIGHPHAHSLLVT
jgi:hypothetical protein